MMEQHIIRLPDPGKRQRRHPERRMALGAADGVFAHPEDALLPLGPTPHLTLPEPEAGRNTVVSAGLSALFHTAILAAIALAGYLAPEAVREAIPVTWVEPAKPVELPGSNDPPAAPRTLASGSRASAAGMAAATPMQTTATHASAAAQVSTATFDMARLDTARAPTQVQMAQVDSRRVAAHSPVAPTPSAANISGVHTVAVNPSDLTAPTVQITGPTHIDPSAPVAIAAASAFANLPGADPSVHSEKATVVAASTVGVGESSFGGSAIETNVSGQYLGGGGSPSGPSGSTSGVPGGSGTGAPSVPCLQSAYVDRYLQAVKGRTEARWVLPDDAAPDEQVVLRFKLDFAGGATDVKVSEASTQQFGTSAQRALRRASPFPPMDDNVRCLIEKTIKLTFRHPAS
ncbi:MAG: TonB family protein [Deltaproteobacteria bacterium]|nr:TonB family protein [Deltaproteobacteria bacterium]